MKITKLLTISAVATALFPLASLAAIDDQGMQYVTAAEGLHGSLRVNILKNEDKEASDETTGGAKESLRLWITGSGDIGNGWATTYYWEVRDGSGGASPGTIGTEAWDIGMRGSMGSVNFGKLGMVAPRMVPGGSLDTVAGGNAGHFASDPGDNGLRFESAVFNGFQVGFSGTALGEEAEAAGEDDLFDEYSFAVKYTSPLGFQVGAGYEVDVMHAERFAGGAAATGFDDKSGWRFGVRYGQDNWLLGYEYRTYDGHPVFGNLNSLTDKYWVTNGTIAATATGPQPAINARPANTHATNLTSTLNSSHDGDFVSQLGYEVHRMGAQVKFDRITASAGYSIETQSLDVTGAIDVDQTTFAVDAAYHLGLNSLIAVGWKKVDTESWARVQSSVSNTSVGYTLYHNASDVSTAAKAKTTTTQLYYRVDF